MIKILKFVGLSILLSLLSAGAGMIFGVEDPTHTIAQWLLFDSRHFIMGAVAYHLLG